jgi:site-specific recombinase XerD
MEEYMNNQKQSDEADFHFLNPGCLTPYLDGFISELKASGYAPLCINNYWQSIAHLGAWLHSESISLSNLNEQTLTAFADHSCACQGGRKHKKLSRKYVARVRRFVCHLIQYGIIDYCEKRYENALPVRIIEFGHWMLHHRGLSPRTIESYKRSLLPLLSMLGEDSAQYDASSIRQAIEFKARQYSTATTKKFATALRTYLRFLSSQGYCLAGLEAAVPIFPQWKLSALPRYLSESAIKLLIGACDINTDCGLRNHAILLLLIRLGLRAGDIVNLRFADIAWNEGVLRVQGKGRREILLPLPQDAGDALLLYLDKVRPSVPLEQVFLCLTAPYRAFPSSTVVSNIVRASLVRAGIDNPPSYGANLLRHSAATSMLRSGATLETISTVLRHKSLDTTAYYAKVDLPMLQPIAQPWPGGALC